MANSMFGSRNRRTKLGGGKERNHAPRVTDSWLRHSATAVKRNGEVALSWFWRMLNLSGRTKLDLGWTRVGRKKNAQKKRFRHFTRQPDTDVSTV